MKRVAVTARQWIPKLSGVQAGLEQDARVADVGYGHGGLTLIMAQAYLKSRIAGYDFQAVDRARAKFARIDCR